jgi:16S rRNA processing protein RimM
MDEADRVIGKVRAIHNFGAGDVIEIERGDGDTLMLPFARDFVPVVDLAARRLVVAQPQEVETGERKHGS